jgi:polar amino acid transport system substrate-binding protein
MRTSPPRARTRLVAAAGTVLLLGGLSGCAGLTGGGDTASAATPAPTLVKDGFLTVCTDMPYAPFEFKQAGKPTGFDVDLVGKVADRLGVELDVADTAFDDIASGEALNKSRCDVAISAMTITGERARVLSFSSPYFDAAQAMVVGKGSGLASLDDLAGQRIGVQGGTTGELYVADHAPADAGVVAFEDAAAMGRAMEDGEVAAMVYDNTVVGDVIKANPDLEVATEFDTGEQYGMAVRRNGDVALLEVINDVLATLKDDGGYEEIYTTWFGPTRS